MVPSSRLEQESAIPLRSDQTEPQQGPWGLPAPQAKCEIQGDLISKFKLFMKTEADRRNFYKLKIKTNILIS